MIERVNENNFTMTSEASVDIDQYIAASDAVSHPRLDVCRVCGSTVAKQLKSCAGCHGVAYCGELCQKADWPQHRAVCKLAAQLRAQGADAQVPVCTVTLPVCGKTATVRWLRDEGAVPSYADGAARIESKMLMKPEASVPDRSALADDPDACDDEEDDENSSVAQLQRLFARANVQSQQIPIAGIPELLPAIVAPEDAVMPGGRIVLAFTYPLTRAAHFAVDVDVPQLARVDMLVLVNRLYSLIFSDCTGSFVCAFHSLDELFLHSLFHFGSPDANSWAVVADA